MGIQTQEAFGTPNTRRLLDQAAIASGTAFGVARLTGGITAVLRPHGIPSSGTGWGSDPWGSAPWGGEDLFGTPLVQHFIPVGLLLTDLRNTDALITGLLPLAAVLTGLAVLDDDLASVALLDDDLSAAVVSDDDLTTVAVSDALVTSQIETSALAVI